MPADVVGVGVGGLEEGVCVCVAAYAKERVVPKSSQIALCVGEKVAVAGSVGTSKNVHLRRGNGLLISLPFRAPACRGVG